MDTPLNASAVPAGTLFSKSTFVVPPFQREYAWGSDEVTEFWNDLKLGVQEQTYFLGLVILTDEGDSKQVVDGQQRILTVSLLAAALYHQALRIGRGALAERINADFLSAIDYETDRIRPRVILSDERDNGTFQAILRNPEHASSLLKLSDEYELSPKLFEAYSFLSNELRSDLADDPFKRLGIWTYSTNYVYFAVFTHPDPSSAYRVFEVINTRGRELTTADLLKNYVLSQTPPDQRVARYEDWRSIARALELGGTGTLVQFIRHVVSLRGGHVLPRDLFDYVAGRLRAGERERRTPPTVTELMQDMEAWAPIYLQMIDPSVAGPAEDDWLRISSSLNALNVLSIRPVVMALSMAKDPTEGMSRFLQLVVRRIVVGNLGTGNVERRFSEAAHKIWKSQTWNEAFKDLSDLDPDRQDFVEQLRKRSLNKSTLTFLRRSIVQQTITPEPTGFMHLIRPRQAPDWDGFPGDEFTYWGSTLGNTFLAAAERRPWSSSTWEGFTAQLLPQAVQGEFVERIASQERWTAGTVEAVGAELARAAAAIWYPEKSP